MIRFERKDTQSLPRSGETNEQAPSIGKSKNELRRIISDLTMQKDNIE